MRARLQIIIGLFLPTCTLADAEGTKSDISTFIKKTFCNFWHIFGQWNFKRPSKISSGHPDTKLTNTFILLPLPLCTYIGRMFLGKTNYRKCLMFATLSKKRHKIEVRVWVLTTATSLKFVPNWCQTYIQVIKEPFAFQTV